MHRSKVLSQVRRVRWQERRQLLDVPSPGPPLRLVTTPERLRFWLTVTRSATNATMWLYGELDLAVQNQLLSAASAQLSVGRPQTITLDLGGLAFLSVSGITTLMTVKQYAEDDEIPFALQNVRPPVRRLFRLCGVTGSFETVVQTGRDTAC
jgi:anti-anti-sigma factor